MQRTVDVVDEVALPPATYHRRLDEALECGRLLNECDRRMAFVVDGKGDPGTYDSDVVNLLVAAFDLHMILDVLKGLRDYRTLKRFVFKVRRPRPVRLIERMGPLEDVYRYAMEQVINAEDRRCFKLASKASTLRRKRWRKARSTNST